MATVELPVTHISQDPGLCGAATAQMIAFNHSRAQILAPHTEVDPWAGVNRGDTAGTETPG